MGWTYTDEAVGREGGAMTTCKVVARIPSPGRAPREVGGPDQGGQEWCPRVWRTTMDSPKMTATS